MKALFDSKKNTGISQLAVFYDKEEIGSTGKTGATNLFFNNI